MSDKQKKPDRRVAKTRRAIRNAFAELFSERSVDEITIKDICDRADISRKTFYYYYGGLWDMVEETENEIVSAFEQLLDGINFKRDIKQPYIIFEKLTAVINADMDFYGCLLTAKRNSELVDKLLVALKRKLVLSFSEQISTDTDKFELVADYSLSGMIAVYQKWMNSDRSQSIEQLSSDLSKLMFGGINAFLNIKNI